MLFDHFHRRTSDLSAGRARPFPAVDDWPAEWRTIYYKLYKVASIPLPAVRDADRDFLKLVPTRRSTRGGHTSGLSLTDVSFILKRSCGPGDHGEEKGTLNRAYPSAGARFPLEIYVVSLKSENEIDAGVYHYAVKDHKLEILRRKVFSATDIRALFTYEWASQCSAAIFLTAVFERSAQKYGERAYRYVLLEAGHVGQGVYLAAASRGVGVTGMGGTNDSAVHELLDVDGTQESLVYTLMLSK